MSKGSKRLSARTQSRIFRHIWGPPPKRQAVRRTRPRRQPPAEPVTDPDQAELHRLEARYEALCQAEMYVAALSVYAEVVALRQQLGLSGATRRQLEERGAI